MLTYLVNLFSNALAVIVVAGLVLAILSWRFRSWKPLFHLYLKALKFSVAAIAQFFWKPAFIRKGTGHLVEERRRQEGP